MGENPASDSMSALCEFKANEVGATLMGHTIRIDETGQFLSVKDAIEIIEGCTSNAAMLRMKKLVNDEIISEATNPNFKYFKYDTTK